MAVPGVVVALVIVLLVIALWCGIFRFCQWLRRRGRGRLLPTSSRDIESRQVQPQNLSELAFARRQGRFPVLYSVLAPGGDADDDSPKSAVERLLEAGHRCGILCAPWFDRAFRAAAMQLKRVLPNDRRQVAALVLSATLYYSDVASDIIVAAIFYSKGHFVYFLWTTLAILFSFLRGVLFAPGLAGSSFFFDPFLLAMQALRLRDAGPMVKREWGNDELDDSRRRMEALAELRRHMWAVTRLEAEAEAPISALVQFYTVCHESYDDWSKGALLTSAFISFASLVKSLQMLDERGTIVWAARLQNGQTFPYVMGVGHGPLVSIAVAAFRALEAGSRIGTLATLQALLRHSFPADFGTEVVFPLCLGWSALVLLVCSECVRRPRHRWHCIQGAMYFPAPLLSPPWVRTSVLSATSYFAIRVSETLLAWITMLFALHSGIARPLGDHKYGLFVVGGTCSAMYALVAAPALLTWTWHQDHKLLQQYVAEHLQTDAHGRVQWPLPEDGGADLWPVLRGYGFEIPRAKHDRERAGAAESTADAEEWCVNPTTSAELSSRNLRFTRESDLDDQAVEDLAEDLGELQVPLQRVCFEDCGKVSASGWRHLMTHLAKVAGHELLEFGFRGAVGQSQNHRSLLSEDRSQAIAEALTDFPVLRKLDFSYNEVSGHVWRLLIDAVRGTEVAELVLKECHLDVPQAEAIGSFLAKLPKLRKIDLSSNRELAAGGWQHILGALRQMEVEELCLASCDLNLHKIETISFILPSLRTIQMLDLSDNIDVPPAGWKAHAEAIFNMSSLRELNLAGCQLGDQVAEDIANPLRKVSMLQQLDLSRNTRLTSHGWHELLAAMGGGGLLELRLSDCELDTVAAEAVIEQLAHFSMLRKVDLSNNGAVAAYVWRGLAYCPVLRCVDLRGCNITQAVKSELIATMATTTFGDGNIQFRSDKLVSLGPSAAPCGTEAHVARKVMVDFRNHSREAAASAFAQFSFMAEVHVKLTSEQVPAIAEVFQHSATRKLNVSGSQISVLGWQLLFDILNGKYLEELSLESCGLDDQRAAAMAKVHAELPRLRKVSLDGNPKLSGGGWESLLEALAGSKVEDLGSVFQGLSEERAAAIAGALPKLQHLRVVDFSHSPGVSPQSWGRLMEALAGRALTRLCVDHCRLDDDIAEAISLHLPKLELNSLQDLRLIGEEERTRPTLVVNMISVHGLVLPPGKVNLHCMGQITDKARTQFRTKASDGGNPVWNQEHTLSHYTEKAALEFAIVDEAVHHNVVLDLMQSRPKGGEVLGRARLEYAQFYPQGFDDVIELSDLKRHSAPSSPGVAPAALHVKVDVLPSINVTAKGLRSILKALHGAQVTDLGGIVNELDDAKASALAEALPGLARIRKLDFTNSWSVNPRGWRELLGAAEDLGLHYLSFSRCRLNDRKAEAISSQLKRLESLRVVDFSWNREVSYNGWASLLRSLRETQVEELHFDDCLINDKKLQAIGRALPDLGSLDPARFTISGNFQISEQGHRRLKQMLASLARRRARAAGEPLPPAAGASDAGDEATTLASPLLTATTTREGSEHGGAPRGEEEDDDEEAGGTVVVARGATLNIGSEALAARAESAASPGRVAGQSPESGALMSSATQGSMTTHAERQLAVS